MSGNLPFNFPWEIARVFPVRHLPARVHVKTCRPFIHNALFLKPASVVTSAPPASAHSRNGHVKAVRHADTDLLKSSPPLPLSSSDILLRFADPGRRDFSRVLCTRGLVLTSIIFGVLLVHLFRRDYDRWRGSAHCVCAPLIPDSRKLHSLHGLIRARYLDRGPESVDLSWLGVSSEWTANLTRRINFVHYFKGVFYIHGSCY